MGKTMKTKRKMPMDCKDWNTRVSELGDMLELTLKTLKPDTPAARMLDVALHMTNSMKRDIKLASPLHASEFAEGQHQSSLSH